MTITIDKTSDLSLYYSNFEIKSRVTICKEIIKYSKFLG